MTGLGEKTLGSVADQIGELLPASLDGTLLAAARIEVAESFEVWMVGLDALVYAVNSRLDVERIARPTSTWHHQIRFDSKALAFARSVVHRRDYGDLWEVQGVFVSDLSAALDQAVQWIDSNLPSTPNARLLEVPSAYTTALWLSEPGCTETKVVVVQGPDGLFTSGYQSVPSRIFLSKLISQIPGAGVLLAVP